MREGSVPAEASGGHRLARFADAGDRRPLAMLPAGILLTSGAPCALALLEGGGHSAAAGSVLADVARFIVALPILVLAILQLNARLEECSS